MYEEFRIGFKVHFAMASLLVLTVSLILIQVSNAEKINIHTCRLSEKERLMCEWHGHGNYEADRPLHGIQMIDFSRFFEPSKIDLRSNAPDLIKLEIHSGDVKCVDLLVNPSVAIYINGQRSCTLKTTVSPLTGVEVSSSGMHSTPSDEANDRTTVKLHVEGAKHSLPIISVTWEDMVLIKVFLILIFAAMVAYIWKLCKPKRKYNRRKPKVDSGCQTDDPTRMAHGCQMVIPARSVRTRANTRRT